MTRRMFLSGAALLPRRGIVLHAIAAPVMPATLRIRCRWAPFFELREYSAGGRDLLARFHRAGIRATLLRERPRPLFLMAFSTLEERATAWTRLNADPDWPGSHAKLSLWRTRALGER